MVLKIHPDMKSELPGLAMAGLNLMATLRGHSGGNGRHVDADGRPVMSAISALIALAIRIWEEKGGSMKDESEMLESMFSNPGVKSEKLAPDERSKVAAVIKKMTKAEQKVFSIAIMVMNPEEGFVDVPEKLGKDGKVIAPAGKRTEKTGVDPRINVLRGIAEHVHANLDNVADVAEMLRGTGSLGGNNEALKVLVKVQVELKKLLSRFFEVESIELITFDMVKAKSSRLINGIFVIPDPKQPLSGYNATAIERGLARVIPFMPPIPTKPVRRTKGTKGGFSWWWVGMVALIILAALVEAYGGRSMERVSGSDSSEPQLVNIPPSGDKR